MSQRVAVIGAGVAATSVIHWLKVLRPLDNIVQFSSENLAPPASLRSTAVAALRGTQRGLSELGDELCDHWEFSDQFYRKLQAPGVESGVLENWLEDDKELRRFSHLESFSLGLLPAKKSPQKIVRENCWLIDPTQLLASFDSNHEQHETLVVGLTKTTSGWRVRTQSDESEFERVIVCTGAWLRWMKDFFPLGELDTLKPSQGSYYEWRDITLPQPSFALSFHGLNLHYRQDLKTLQLGATTIKGSDSLLASKPHLMEIERVFSETLALELDFSRASVHTGIRAITKSRRPFAGELERGLYALNGLYKNGWISAWPLGKKLVESL